VTTRLRSRATSFDVAALAGVSQSAVSRAFSPGASISEAKRAKIVEAARKLNYVPNSIASSLTTKRTNIVAVIIGTLNNPFYVEALKMFSRKLQEQGRQILTFTVDGQTNTDAIIMRVLQYQVDGIVITSANLSTRMTGLSHERGIPVVLFNRYVPGADATCIRCDNAHGGGLIARAFLAAGARRFAMITGDPTATTSQDRVRGFLDVLADHGIRRSTVVHAPGQSSYDGGAAAAASLFGGRSRRTRPDALFCVNDVMAMGALDALRLTLGFAVPGDLMVAGFDDIPEAARLPYRLTTIRTPTEAMVDEALAALHLDNPGHAVETGVDRAIRGEFIKRATLPHSPVGEP
jgi:DNA-binding LacI/PurR family transcriptional regulator